MVRRSPQTDRLLTVLLRDPIVWRYGYELLKETGLQSGTLYPLLTRLSDHGLLEAEWQAAETPGRPPRHIYRLTTSGIAFARDRLQPPAPVATKSRWAKA